MNRPEPTVPDAGYRAMFETRMVNVAPGVDLCVLDHPGVHPPILMVHGLASNARMWLGVGAHLGERAWRAVDVRGHGESSKVDDGYDFATISADLSGLLDDPVVIVGQSWGGNVAIDFASRYPELVRGVVCVDGGFLRLAADFPTWEEAQRTLRPPGLTGMTRAGLEAGVRARFSGWPESGILAQLANFEELADGTVRSRLTWERHRRILRAMWEQDVPAVAAKVTAPTLVIAVSGGWPSKTDRVAELVDTLPAGQVMWVDGDHDIHAQHPELVASAVLGVV